MKIFVGLKQNIQLLKRKVLLAFVIREVYVKAFKKRSGKHICDVRENLN